MINRPFLYRVQIRNFKSIGACDVELGRFTLLVGRNGSGKSNFLDALRFVVDGLEASLDHAIKSRGGIDEVRRRGMGHPHNFALKLSFQAGDRHFAEYGFEVASQPKGGFQLKSEKLQIHNAANCVVAEFRVANGVLVSESRDSMPPPSSDRLYLVSAAGLPAFRPAFDALLAMGFYNLNPQQMKEIQSPDAGELLRRDGSNIASVVARLGEDQPEVKQRIRDYLAAIVPDIVDFERVALGHRETLRFRQKMKGSKHPWHFYAANMSDGTLRTLGILVAAMQLSNRRAPVHLVGIEEPETALHPAAAGTLMDSLREAAVHTQVLLTTHSPDLLEQFIPNSDTLLVVQATEGTTQIAPVDEVSRNAIQNHLYTAAELLRLDQLQPNRASITQQRELVFD